MTVSFTVIPTPADVNQIASAEATITPAPGSNVTMTIKDETGAIIKQRTFSADPYKLGFTPGSTGTWTVEVSGGATGSYAFQVV